MSSPYRKHLGRPTLIMGVTPLQLAVVCLLFVISVLVTLPKPNPIYGAVICIPIYLVFFVRAMAEPDNDKIWLNKLQRLAEAMLGPCFRGQPFLSPKSTYRNGPPGYVP